MIPVENKLKFILSELYNKICTCPEEHEEHRGMLNPSLHTAGCMYRLAVEKETNIQWTNEEQTQDS